MEVEFSKQARKFNKKLPAKQERQIVSKCMSLTLDPLPQDSKPMRGYPGFFRVDSGEYRIIYEILEPTILITLIGKRNDDEIYRRFKRSH